MNTYLFTQLLNVTNIAPITNALVDATDDFSTSTVLTTKQYLDPIDEIDLGKFDEIIDWDDLLENGVSAMDGRLPTIPTVPQHTLDSFYTCGFEEASNLTNESYQSDHIYKDFYTHGQFNSSIPLIPLVNEGGMVQSWNAPGLPPFLNEDQAAYLSHLVVSPSSSTTDELKSSVHSKRKRKIGKKEAQSRKRFKTSPAEVIDVKDLQLAVHSTIQPAASLKNEKYPPRNKINMEEFRKRKIGVACFNVTLSTCALQMERKGVHTFSTEIGFHHVPGRIEITLQRKDISSPGMQFQDAVPKMDGARVFTEAEEVPYVKLSYEPSKMLVDITGTGQSMIRISTAYIAVSHLANYAPKRGYVYRLKFVRVDVEYSEIFYRINGGSNEDHAEILERHLKVLISDVEKQPHESYKDRRARVNRLLQ
jgi:hypothetical protein